MYLLINRNLVELVFLLIVHIYTYMSLTHNCSFVLHLFTEGKVQGDVCGGQCVYKAHVYTSRVQFSVMFQQKKHLGLGERQKLVARSWNTLHCPNLW